MAPFVALLAGVVCGSSFVLVGSGLAGWLLVGVVVVVMWLTGLVVVCVHTDVRVVIKRACDH